MVIDLLKGTRVLQDEIFLWVIGHKAFHNTHFFLLSILCFFCSFLLFGFFVNPFYGPWFLLQFFLGRRWNWSHLWVDEGVSEEKFFTGESRLSVGKLVPFWWNVFTHLVLETSRIWGKLLDKCSANFKVRSATVQKFETFQERPLVLAHNVRSQSAGSPTLATNWVHQNRLSRLKSFINKLKNCICCLISWIKQQLKTREIQNFINDLNKFKRSFSRKSEFKLEFEKWKILHT